MKICKVVRVVTYNFDEMEPKKRYRRVKRGWHPGKIHQASLKNSFGGQFSQYIKVDFEIIREKEYSNVLVPGFYNYNKSWKPDQRFLDLGKAAGLRGDYGNDINAVLRDLKGKELSVYVVHRYKNGWRREQVKDFRSLPG
jgi:hypothetical protein